MPDSPWVSEMTAERLAAALEREHHEIDAGIEAFLDRREDGEPRVQGLRQAIEALRRHIYLEEAFLFPPLQDAGLVAPIFVMLREHGEIWKTMDALDAQMRDRTECGPSEHNCRELLAQLEPHNSKEEAVIYPQADTMLPEETDAALREFLTSGETPSGWACRQARA